jgi:hypothetical protein
MPEPGERRTKNGETREWTGAEWQLVPEPGVLDALPPDLFGSSAPAATWGALKTVPAVVSKAHQVATAGAELGAAANAALGPLAPYARWAGRAAPGVLYSQAGWDLIQGRPGEAAKRAALGTAVSTVPKVAQAVARATTPPGVLPPFGTTPGGWLARGAGFLGRAATPVALALQMLGTTGDRPLGETPETTAARQKRFEQEYAETLRRKAGR